MKLAIIGSRTFNDYALLSQTLKPFLPKITLVVSGAAKGADSLGERWAIENKLKTLIFPADWNQYGKRAGFIRNVDIIENCDYCIAFYDGTSKGTAHAIKLCKKYNKPCNIINYD